MTAKGSLWPAALQGYVCFLWGSPSRGSPDRNGTMRDQKSFFLAVQLLGLLTSSVGSLALSSLLVSGETGSIH